MPRFRTAALLFANLEGASADTRQGSKSPDIHWVAWRMMLYLNETGYRGPLQHAQVDKSGDDLSRRAPDGVEVFKPPSACATIHHLQGECASGTGDGEVMFSPVAEENAGADRRQLQLRNALAFWQIDLAELSLNSLCARESIEVLAWFLMDFKDQCDFHWPETQHPHLMGSRRGSIRNILDHAAIDHAFYQDIIDILIARPQACIDDCELKLAEMSFLSLAGRVGSVGDGAKAAFRQGCMTCAARLSLQADPGDESLESFALVNFHLQKVLASYIGPVDAMVLAEPQCTGDATISHARARDIAEQALRYELENDYPYTRGAMITSPGIKDALQRCLYSNDAGFRQSVSALRRQYENRTAELDLLQPGDIEKVQRFLCETNEAVAASASAIYLSELKAALIPGSTDGAPRPVAQPGC